jgi:ribosomal protein S18 acetylase RimI-like enzyme
VDFTIQPYLRAAASRGRDTLQVGPFLATINPATEHPYLNYAIPDDGAAPTAADVHALIAAYRQRGRVPRLEYLPAVAPAAEAALTAGGFAVEARLPLMTCTPGGVAVLPPPVGVELVLARSDDELLATATVQAAAFDEPAPCAEAISSLCQTLEVGGIVVLARELATGEPAGGGLCLAPVDGVAEVAGIGVAERFRRRGIAAALTARLAAEAFAAGVTTAFLTPGDDGAGRAYARAGLAATTRMLHLMHPPD